MVRIRPFHRQDREAVRRICTDVAFLGEAVEAVCPDRKLAADALSAYYTDYEPEHSLVAEIDGRVVGYINGCIDNRRYGLAVLFLIVPKLICKAFFRGFFFKVQGRLLVRSWMLSAQRLMRWRKESFYSHQGHLHIGVIKEFRRHHLGQMLLDAFIDSLKGQDIHEITASVHADNSSACRFFEKQGFYSKERYGMSMAVGHVLREYTSILYAKNID